MTWADVKEGIALASGIATAMFAGLVWWLARGRLSPNYELIPDRIIHRNLLRANLILANDSSKAVSIEAIEIDPPCHLVVSTTGVLTRLVNRDDQYETSNQARYRVVLPAGETHRSEIIFSSPDGFRSTKKIRISLQTVTSRALIRHRKKAITAIIPEAIIRDQD